MGQFSFCRTFPFRVIRHLLVSLYLWTYSADDKMIAIINEDK